jgi:hypothetical protein
MSSNDTMMVIALVSFAVLGWLFCAFYTAGRARANGRNYHLWLTIGLLLGPIAFVLSLVLFRSIGERHRRQRYGEGGKYDVPEMMTCPGCGESVPRSYGSCQFCGASLSRGKRK